MELTKKTLESGIKLYTKRITELSEELDFCKCTLAYLQSVKPIDDK